MTERDLVALGALLGSPALDLEPPVDLVEGVRRDARRVHRRRNIGTVALSVLLVAGAVTVVPPLVGGDHRDGAGQVAQVLPPDSRFPGATSPIAVLARINGGEVVSWFEGNRWCTGASRVDTARLCSRGVGAKVAPFAFVRDRGNETLTIDADGLVAGLLGTGVEHVRVRLSDGTTVPTTRTQPEGFVRPVWLLRVPRGLTVDALVAYDAAGSVVATR